MNGFDNYGYDKNSTDPENRNENLTSRASKVKNNVL